MLRLSGSTSLKTTAVGVLTVGVLFIAPLAFAADTPVVQDVNGGARTAAVTGPTLAAVTTSHSAQDSTGTSALAVDDLTGTGAGWEVSEVVTDFIYSGAYSGTDIPAANFSIVPATPTSPNSASLTGVSAGSGGTLDTARIVLSATAGNGVGSYAQDSDATLTVPADARVGTYTATLTTTITAAP